MGPGERSSTAAGGSSRREAFEGGGAQATSLGALPGSRTRTFAPGETIARQGESVRDIHRLVSGRVQARVVPGEDGVPDDDAVRDRGRAVAVAARRGDLPGEAGALLEMRASSLLAETAVELEVTPARPEDLSRMILDQPDLGLALGESLARRLLDAVRGLGLLDACLSELGREVDAQAAALDRLVEDLAARRGGLAEVAARARAGALARRGDERGPAQLASRRSSRSRPSERRRVGEAAAELARAGAGDTVELAAGAWLCREDEAAGAFFLVLKGELEIVASDTRLGRAREGEVAGELWALLPRGTRRTVGLRATRPARVLRIPAGRLPALAAERPALALHVARVLSRRLKRAYRALAGQEDALARLTDDLDGSRRSLASEYAALGAALAGWSEEVPGIVREVGARLAAVRERARRSRAEAEERERAILAGACFGEILGRREFDAAVSHLGRAFDLLRGRGAADGDPSDEVAAAADAIVAYAGLGCDRHCRGRGEGGLELHSVGTAVWALTVARRTGCDARGAREVALAALLHDVGMLRAETGPGFRMEAHPTEYATPYLARLKGVPPGILPIVCQHHEHVDGSGYPRRLTGERMCRGGMILSAANRLDLLVSKGLPPGEAGRALAPEASRYDPRVLSAILRAAEEAEA